MKRILVAAIGHESNSFNPIIAGAEDFRVRYEEEVYQYINDYDSISGIITTLQKHAYDIVPTVFARAVPNGEVDYSFYVGLKDFLIQKAKEAKEAGVDGIVLALHGSMRVKAFGEAEGDLLEALRQLYPDVPIFVALDMHTTMTEKMHRHCDGFVGYKCAPHTDCFETGVHAAKLLIQTLEDGRKPYSAWVKVPLLVAGEQSETTTEPMVELIGALRQQETEDCVMAASYLMGFPWSDNEDSSAAVYVVVDGSQAEANRRGLQLAQLMWSRRQDFKFHTETYKPEQALDVAFRELGQSPLPIYLSDSGDNPTAGSTGDCTDFLRLMLEDERTDLLKSPIIYGGLYDPKAVEICEKHVEETIELTFGGAFDKVTTKPLTEIGQVKSFVKGWNKGGFTSDVALFHVKGVDIVLTKAHIGYVVPDLFTDLGRDPKEADLVVCKLGYLTEPQRRVAGRSIMALTTGSTNENLESLTFNKVIRPIYPLDKVFDYKPEDYLK